MFPDAIMFEIYQYSDVPMYHSLTLTCKPWWSVARDNNQRLLGQVLKQEFSWLFKSPIHGEAWREVVLEASTQALQTLFTNLKGTKTTIENLPSTEVLQSITVDDILCYTKSVSRDHSWYKHILFSQPSVFRVIFHPPQVSTPETRQRGNYWSFGGHSLFESIFYYSQLETYNNMKDVLSEDPLARVTSVPVTCCIGNSMNSRIAMRVMGRDLNALHTKFPIDLVSQHFPDVLSFGPQTEGKNFWEAMQNAESDLFNKCLGRCARLEEIEELRGLRNAACMLLEFALGAGIQGQKARKEALAKWWTKNLAGWEEIKDDIQEDDYW